MEPEHARQLLARERERVERTLEARGSGENDEPPDPFEASDAAPTLLESEMDLGVSERLRDELNAIERAEQRLEQGTFGRSLQSGEPIPDARLEAIPWAERTTEEQGRLEQGG